MTLSVDGSANHTATNNNVITATLTTTNSQDIIILFVHAEWLNSVGSNGTVSGVSDTAGLSWAQRSSQTLHPASSAYADYECWWAYSSGTLSSDVITVTFTKPGGTSNFDDASIVAFGVTGFTGTLYHTSPWDLNSSLPAKATATNTSAPSVSSVSCGANALMLGACGTAQSGTSQTAGSGYTQIANSINSGGGNFSDSAVEDQFFSSSQSSITVSFGSNFTTWIMIADALAQAGGVTPPVVGPRLRQYLRR